MQRVILDWLLDQILFLMEQLEKHELGQKIREQYFNNVDFPHFVIVL